MTIIRNTFNKNSIPSLTEELTTTLEQTTGKDRELTYSMILHDLNNRLNEQRRAYVSTLLYGTRTINGKVSSSSLRTAHAILTK